MPDGRPRNIPSMIGQLHDVDVSTTPPADGDVLVWDDTAKKWKPGTVTAAQQFFDQNTPAAAFIDASTAQQLQTTTIVLPAITYAAGDLLLIVLAADDFSGFVQAADWAPPAGWSLMFNNQDGGTAQLNVAVYYKTATASEPATYTFTRTDSVLTTRMWANGALLGYRPVAVPQLDSNYSLNRQTPSGGAPVTAGVVASNYHDRLVCIYAGNSNPNFTAPTGMTQRTYTKISPPNTGTCYLGVCDEALTAPGATGARTATLDQNTNGQADALLINP